MARHYQVFCVPKRDHSELEYEDASAAAPELDSFAIADGATDSSFAALWAQLLVKEFVRTPTCQASDWRQWLPPLQERWEAEVAHLVLPWYAETKLQPGAFTTFLGVVVDGANNRNGNCWRAVAVGDCCLFQIRQQSLHLVFPNYRSGDFTNRPALVGSRTTPELLLKKNRVQTGSGNWQADDQIWLMTDALAKWFLLQHEAGKQPCEAVDRVVTAASSQSFATWIDELRITRELRNDDVTLLAVRL